jgi:glycosyltransferase involved in cell wall biosynthesis
MANILINGFSAKSGGGKTIFDNYLLCLTEGSRDGFDDYYVITPNASFYRSWNSDRIHVLPISTGYQKAFMLPLFYACKLGRIIRANKIDAILNFGDIVLPVNIPQVYFFDWSYLVYPESVAWQKMDINSYVQRRVKYHLIRFTLKYAAIVVAQTPTMVKRLKELYGLKTVILVRSPVTISSMKKTVDRDFGFPEKRKMLLCLANYAPHKNLEILAPLARLMKQRRDEFTIVTTLDTGRNKDARNLSAAVETENLNDYILNVGHVDPLHIPALFEQCHALLLPTLLESYGLPFVEAMFNKRTIITSDFDFTRDVCGDAAYYFNPLDVETIYQAIRTAFADESARLQKIDLGFKIALALNDWKNVFLQYQDCLRKV